MVGQVTTIKKPVKLENVGDTLPDTELAEDDSENEFEPDLRDAFENIYATIANTEEILIGPGTRNTWIATPLAIYHEVN